jgi:hypothetical protein
MNKEIKLFMDLEFTGLTRTTTPISLGIVSEDNKTFYAEFSDYNAFLCDNWIKENVIANLEFKDKVGMYTSNDRSNYKVYGTKYFIRRHLMYWLEQFGDSKLQFYADVCHYDFVLLIDIMAESALSLPLNISASCHDINQDIAKYYNITDKEAFDKNREALLVDNDMSLPKGKQHNSLYDAILAKNIYEKINR